VEDHLAPDDLIIVFGPRTALAEHLLAIDGAARGNLILVARDAEDISHLSSRYPHAELLTGHDVRSPERWPQTVRAATIIVCAFGLIHPAAPDWARHAQAMSRDLETIAAVIDKCRRFPVTLIFVSTALAAAPNKDRAYYAGWKYLSEAILKDLAATHNDVRLCVLLPGRLVERRTLAQPSSLVHTSYDALARVIIKTAKAPKVRRQVVGLDARALMVIRGIRLLAGGTLGGSA
jgi:NADP-dependent 3-hydroxy acid dehydrogenase YdfG